VPVHNVRTVAYTNSYFCYDRYDRYDRPLKINDLSVQKWSKRSKWNAL